jgi:hypothetical protein
MELSSASSSVYRVGAAVSVNIKFTLVGNLSELKRCFSPYIIGFEETPAKRKQEVLPEEAHDRCDTSGGQI